MIYYLKICELGIRIDCPEDVLLFDDWKRFFEQEWAGNFLVKDLDSVDIIVNLTNGKTIKDVDVVGSKISFHCCLNPSLLVLHIRNLAGEILLEKEIVLLHASGFVADNKAYLISGNSGAGKTTLLGRLTGKGYKALGDDVVGVRIDGSKLTAYPSPFNLKLKLEAFVQGEYEVDKLIFVNKGEIKVDKVNKKDALIMVLNQVRAVMNSKAAAKLGFGLATNIKDRVYEITYWLGDDISGLIKKVIYD